MSEIRFYLRRGLLWVRWCVLANPFLISVTNGQDTDLANFEYPLDNTRSNQTNNRFVTPKDSKFPKDISGVWENTTNVPAYDFNGHVRRESEFKLTLMQENQVVKGTFLMRVFMSGGVVQKHTRVAGSYKQGILSLKTTGIIKGGCFAPENVAGLYDLNFKGRITNKDGVLTLDGHYDFATQKSFQSRDGQLIFTNAVLGLKGPVKIYATRTAPLQPAQAVKSSTEIKEEELPTEVVHSFREADTVFSHILFRQSETDFLTPNDSLEIVRLGDILEKYPELKVKLEGYTENRGLLRENIELSIQRSEFVKKYLTEQKKISSERISTAGFGPYNPVGDNRNEKTRRLNRRVEIKVFAN